MGELEDQLRAANETTENERNRADDLQRKLTLAQEENERLEDRIAEHADGNNRQTMEMRAEAAERKIVDLEQQLEAAQDALEAAKEETLAAKAANDEMLREL